jgi:hypothetical protein
MWYIFSCSRYTTLECEGKNMDDHQILYDVQYNGRLCGWTNLDNLFITAMANAFIFRMRRQEYGDHQILYVYNIMVN